MSSNRLNFLWRLVVLAVLSGLATPTSSQAGKAEAEEAYRDFFWLDRADDRGLLERALSAIGFSSDIVGRSYALIAGVDHYPRMGIGGNLPPV